ncbi:unnamed protein product [Darwinula stevensoni]|uniref:WAP domain-containing protein n=1 Tax=Darwinula stevensoni TaxID=69355 RepID=A0A7R8XEI4_9CRUS|nr:unnamed protein product [Darwinula stevensoni]CAG0889724.1 unnamed protein product [Darwinula stevensoni]
MLKDVPQDSDEAVVAGEKRRSFRNLKSTKIAMMIVGLLVALASLASTLEAAECPIPWGWGLCVELCSSDADCSEGLLCCSNGCGHQCMAPQLTCSDVECPEDCVMGHVICDLPPGFCPLMPFCVPYDAFTCEDVTCEPGETCVMQEVVCVTEPCYPVPECIPE